MGNIAWLDLETTGLDVKKDRIVSMALVINGKGPGYHWLFNPLVRINASATAVHGITNQDVEDCPTFRDKVQTIVNRLRLCSTLAGFNIRRFDIPMLAAELDRNAIDPSFLLGMDVMDIYQEATKRHPRDLAAIYEMYTGKRLSNAHDAMADVKATLEIAEAMEKTAPVGSLSVQRLLNDGRFAFGKHKGELPTPSTHSSWLWWLVREGDPLIAREAMALLKLMGASS